MKLDWNTITTSVVVVMLTYIGLSMVINATGTGMQKLNKESEDPKFSTSIGDRIASPGGDFVGTYSANLTGGIKLNYPWPLHDGPGMSLDLTA
tara:strand:- start:803 stop:1081 length:279 start_codon:yes stop_codon:yes gene_type:complete